MGTPTKDFVLGAPTEDLVLGAPTEKLLFGADAHGSRDIHWYGCPTAYGIREAQHLLFAIRARVKKSEVQLCLWV